MHSIFIPDSLVVVESFFFQKCKAREVEKNFLDYWVLCVNYKLTSEKNDKSSQEKARVSCLICSLISIKVGDVES